MSPQKCYPNPHNLSSSNYDELIQRIYSVTVRINYRQGLKRSNLPGKRSLWVNKLSSEDMDAFEDHSSSFKRTPIPLHQVNATLQHEFSSTENIPSREPIKQPRSMNFVQETISTVKISTTDI